MNCPNCNLPLTIAERHRVEIDYCQQCRGVWLDRGELDKIIERAEQIQNAPPEDRRPREEYREDSYRGERYDRDDDDYRHKKKKRGGFLGEIFDFD